MANTCLLKKLLWCITLSSAMNLSLSGQDLFIYVMHENLETVITNSRMLMTEPFLLEHQIGAPGNNEILNLFPENEEEEASLRAQGRFRIAAEMVVTPNSRFLRVPLSYETNDLDFSLSFPLYVRRTMKYSHEDISDRGLGDLQIQATYHMRREQLHNRTILTAKLPTGDANNMKNGFPVPMGTGTTDFMASNVTVMPRGDYTLYGSVSYRISGDDTRTVEVFYPTFNANEVIEYKISHGNTLMLNTALTYHLPLGLGVTGGISILYNTRGEMDKEHTYGWDKPSANLVGLDLAQDFFLIDLNAGLTYSLFDMDIMLSFMPPVFTKRNVSNTEAGRKMMLLAKVTRNLF